MSDATTTPERPFFGQPFGWLVLAVALALWWRAFGPGASLGGDGAPPA